MASDSLDQTIVDKDDKAPLSIHLETKSSANESALATLLAYQDPWSCCAPIPFLGLSILGAFGCLLLSLTRLRPDLNWVFLPTGVGVFAAGAFWAVFALVRNRHMEGQYSDLVYAGVDEVMGMRQGVANFMQNLDERTRKYFHCVTNSKVVNYFILRQIENSLGELIARLETVMSGLAPHKPMRVHELLLEPLIYRDGFQFNSGNEYRASLAEIKQVIAHTIQELEAGVASLESEIALEKKEIYERKEGA